MVNCAKCGIFLLYGNWTRSLQLPHAALSGGFMIGLPLSTRNQNHPKYGLSARVESAGYRVWPRLREIMEFSRLAGFKVGAPFCVGLRREALDVTKIFENNGLR